MKVVPDPNCPAGRFWMVTGGRAYRSYEEIVVSQSVVAAVKIPCPSCGTPRHWDRGDSGHSCFKLGGHPSRLSGLLRITHLNSMLEHYGIAVVEGFENLAVLHVPHRVVVPAEWLEVYLPPEIGIEGIVDPHSFGRLVRYVGELQEALVVAEVMVS